MTKKKGCVFLYADGHELDRETLEELQKAVKEFGVNIHSIPTSGTFYKLAVCPRKVSLKEAEKLWYEAHPEELEEE